MSFSYQAIKTLIPSRRMFVLSTVKPSSLGQLYLTNLVNYIQQIEGSVSCSQ